MVNRISQVRVGAKLHIREVWKMTAGVKAIFVNLPVKDLTKSMDFFKALGFKFNEQFTDNNGASMIVADSILVMLLTEEFFTSFTHLGITDTSKENEVILALQVESKDAVDKLVNTAIENVVTEIPLGVVLSSGSAVKRPVKTTKLNIYCFLLALLFDNHDTKYTVSNFCDTL